jgi:hypothetical protein
MAVITWLVATFVSVYETHRTERLLTGWLRAAMGNEAYELPLGSHLNPGFAQSKDLPV